MLKLYGFSHVNSLAYGLTRDLRVLWAMEEIGLPFELVGLDHPAGELNTDVYRRISPFEQIPVLEDGSVVLSESGAILIYLARKSGKLIPPDAAGEPDPMASGGSRMPWSAGLTRLQVMSQEKTKCSQPCRRPAS